MRQIDGDLHFRALKSKIKKLSRKDRSTSAPWILDTTWKIADQRTALVRKSRTNQGEHRVLTQRSQADLNEDRKIRMRRAGEEIKALMSNNQVKEAWSKTQRWYREAKGHRVPPTSEHLDQTSNLREDLYRHRPPEGERIPILIQPVSISEGPPEGG